MNSLLKKSCSWIAYSNLRCCKCKINDVKGKAKLTLLQVNQGMNQQTEKDI